VIAKPTTEQLIETVRHELRTRVAPCVSDPVARLALDMSIAVLGSAAVRSAHELAWMLDEAEAIEALARDLVARLPALAEALYEPGAVRDIAGAHERYERASELLARTAEAAYEAGDREAIRAVMALFAQRRGNQNTVTGGYQAVGRG
jgi:hypothetical protein